MSSSPESSGSSSRRPAVPPEKPTNFSQTCSLLRRYLKENGGFGELNIDMKCNGGSTRSRTMDLFPQHPSIVNPAAEEDHQEICNLGLKKPMRPKPQMAQMTMIYGGKVFIFNDVPPEKAEEIIVLAKEEGSTQIYTQANQKTAPVTRVAKTQTEHRSSVAATDNIIQSFLNNSNQDGTQDSTAQIPIELPIARRNSLHRFLEKRKDRFVGRAPYQISGGPLAARSKPAESKSWLGLAAQPLQESRI